MLPFKYLGIPIVGRELQLADCNSLVDQLQNYLSHWKNKLLSMGRRVQLVNWVITDKILYWFQSLLIPTVILKLARQIVYQFIWGKT